MAISQTQLRAKIDEYKNENGKDPFAIYLNPIDYEDFKSQFNIGKEYPTPITGFSIENISVLVDTELPTGTISLA